MAKWEVEFQKMMHENAIKVWMSKLFVDDQNLLFNKFKRGTRWYDGKLVWKQEWQEEDEDKNEPDDARCMREVRLMSNTIRRDIQMEEDVGSRHEDGKLPILDFKMWQVKHEG